MKKKLSLDALKVKSFITSTDMDLKTIQGGDDEQISGQPCSVVTLPPSDTIRGQNTCNVTQLTCPQQSLNGNGC